MRKRSARLGFGVLLIFTLLSVPRAVLARDEIFMNSLGLSFGGDASQLSFSPGYNKPLTTWLELGGALNYQKLSYATSDVSIFTLQVGPTFDLGPMENTFFLSLGFAIRSGNGVVASGGTDPAGSGPYFYVGRRIPLGMLAYRPSIGLQSAGGTSFILNFLAFSYFL